MPGQKFLEGLRRGQVRALEPGIVRYDWVTLADIVNTQVNGFQASGDGPPKLRPGGVEIATSDGAYVECGEILLDAYTAQEDPELLVSLAKAFTIDNPARPSSA